MLRFLSSLFSPAGTIPDKPDRQLVDAAIERAVDATDRRLRGLGNYRKALRPAVETAARHILGIVESLPAAVEISRSSFGQEPRLRAFFVSPQHLQEAIGGFPAVRDYLKAQQGALPASLFGCLSMDYREKKSLGMQLHGDTVQREVAQVTVSFVDHRYVGPSDSEAATRRELATRGYDFLVEKALEAMVAGEERRVELEQQRRILARKLETLHAGNWGLEQMLATEQAAHPDFAQLENELEQLDQELESLGPQPRELQRRLQCLVDVLGQAPAWLTTRQVDICLDSMLVKKEAAQQGGATQISFTEVRAKSGERRVILLARFPLAELPPQTDFFSEADRYLG